MSILLASLTSKYRLVFMEAMYLVCNISRFRMRFTGDVHVPEQIIFVCSMLETKNFCWQGFRLCTLWLTSSVIKNYVIVFLPPCCVQYYSIIFALCYCFRLCTLWLKSSIILNFVLLFIYLVKCIYENDPFGCHFRILSF